MVVLRSQQTTLNILFILGTIYSMYMKKEDYSSDVPLTDDDIKGLWDL